MSRAIIFLRDSLVFALTVPIPSYVWIDKVTAEVPDPLVKLTEGQFIRKSEYEAAVASARESAVRVDTNSLLQLMNWRNVEDNLNEKFYTLGEEYKLGLTYEAPNVNSAIVSATIYKKTAKAIETPLSALRNKLSPFINLTAMVKQEIGLPFHVFYIKKEAERCDTEEVHRLLLELETPKEEKQDELWNDVWEELQHSGHGKIEELRTGFRSIASKFILTRKEDVTH